MVRHRTSLVWLIAIIQGKEFGCDVPVLVHLGSQTSLRRGSCNVRYVDHYEIKGGLQPSNLTGYDVFFTNDMGVVPYMSRKNNWYQIDVLDAWRPAEDLEEIMRNKSHLVSAIFPADIYSRQDMHWMLKLAVEMESALGSDHIFVDDQTEDTYKKAFLPYRFSIVVDPEPNRTSLAYARTMAYHTVPVFNGFFDYGGLFALLTVGFDEWEPFASILDRIQELNNSIGRLWAFHRLLLDTMSYRYSTEFSQRILRHSCVACSIHRTWQKSRENEVSVESNTTKDAEKSYDASSGRENVSSTAMSSEMEPFGAVESDAVVTVGASSLTSLEEKSSEAGTPTAYEPALPSHGKNSSATQTSETEKSSDIERIPDTLNSSYTKLSDSTRSQVAENATNASNSMAESSDDSPAESSNSSAKLLAAENVTKEPYDSQNASNVENSTTTPTTELPKSSNESDISGAELVSGDGTPPRVQKPYDMPHSSDAISNTSSRARMPHENENSSVVEPNVTSYMERVKAENVGRLENSAAAVETAADGSDDRPLVYVGIYSAMKNVELRNAIRQTWGKVIRDMGFRCDFYLNTATAVERAEARKFGDIIVLDVLEGYRHNSRKGILFHRYVSMNSDALFLLKLDDDIYLRPYQLIEQLKTKPPFSYVWGFFDLSSPIPEDTEDDFHNPPEVYPFQVFPPYARGCARVTSMDVIRKIAEMDRDGKLRNIFGDDPNFGVHLRYVTMDEHPLALYLDDFDSYRRFAMNPQCKPPVSEQGPPDTTYDPHSGTPRPKYFATIRSRSWVIHHVSPSQIRCMWNIDVEELRGNWSSVELPSLCSCGEQPAEST